MSPPITTRVIVVGALGSSVLSALLFHRPPAAPRATISPAPAWSASEADLRKARDLRLRVVHWVDQQRYALESWDPSATANWNSETWRRELMAEAPGGDLRRARMAARRAAQSALTREEAYRAALLLARLECESGNHVEELRQAYRLLALEPRNQLTMRYLRHAAACNRLAPRPLGRDGARHASLNKPATVLTQPRQPVRCGGRAEHHRAFYGRAQTGRSRWRWNLYAGHDRGYGESVARSG